MDETLKAIKIRLEVIINLMIQKEGPEHNESRSLRDQIGLLNSFGLKPKEIAEILGRTGSHINKELTVLRKSK